MREPLLIQINTKSMTTKTEVQYPERITLHLLPIDFKLTQFTNNFNCALAKAFKRQEGHKYVSESLDNISVRDSKDGNELVTYRHDYYGNDEFNDDRKIAEAAGWDSDVVIRTLKLRKI